MVATELRLSQRQTPRLTVVTDASLLGWDSLLGEVEIRGCWFLAESQLHINLLERRAIRLALKALLPSIKGRLVQVFIDNTTAMWYYNKKGRVGSWTLCQEDMLLWNWL